MDNEEKLHKELDLIQGCITRMANNSFMIKGWTLTLFVALITFFNIKDLSTVLLIFSLVVIVFLFAYLDAFYLWQERKYVRLYSDVIEKRQKMDFSNLYNLNTKKYEIETIFDVIRNKRYELEYLEDNPKKKLKAWWNAQKRNTIGIFYGSLALFICLYSIFTIYSFNKIEKKQEYEITIKEANVSINKLEDYCATIALKLDDLSTTETDNKDKILKIGTQLEDVEKKITELNSTIQRISKEQNKK